jgi:hypothetical protein
LLNHIRLCCTHLSLSSAHSAKEIQHEIEQLKLVVTESDKVIKGIQKMSSVYSTQKDNKNAKLVEDQVAGKLAQVEQTKKKIESLHQELRRLQKEEDPVYLVQESQRVKEKVECLYLVEAFV